MSLLVEGFPVSSVGFAATQRTVLSRSFYESLQRPAPRLLFTTTVAPYGTCSTVLICDVSSAANYDVVLGHDWASLLRDHLISLGHRLSSNFDPWQLFLTAPAITPAASSGGLNGTKLGSFSSPLNRTSAPALAVSRQPSELFAPPALKCSPARSVMKVKHYVPPTGKFFVEQGQSSKSSSISIRREDVEVQESLAELLLSTNDDAIMPPKPLIKLLNSHHIDKPKDLTIRGARHALLAHLLTGACIATCDSAFQNVQYCQCKENCSLYPTQQAQSFALLSVRRQVA
ncbi:hypothetical protein B0H13DRAFT_1856545 [Mycena leptocephala]|nr:hypothetical protein B0H13DRAFT_1856545 [Mycena leptocephala]